jgi:hypothetical protein
MVAKLFGHTAAAAKAAADSVLGEVGLSDDGGRLVREDWHASTFRSTSLWDDGGLREMSFLEGHGAQTSPQNLATTCLFATGRSISVVQRGWRRSRRRFPR